MKGDVNLTAIIDREGIESVRKWLGGLRYSVTLDDGRHGVGRTVGEALEKAKASTFSIRRAA
jgi:hypothetical protein